MAGSVLSDVGYGLAVNCLYCAYAYALYPNVSRTMIMKGVDLSKAFSASSEMIMWVYFCLIYIVDYIY